MEKYVVAVVLIACLIFSLGARINLKTTQASEITKEQVLLIPQPIKTDSEFRTELETKQIEIERAVVYKDNPEMEIGEEKVIEEGSDGIKTQVIKTTYHLDKIYDREVLSTEVTPAKNKIVGKGTKIVWRSVNIQDGEVKYWRKMRVWATHYDSHCLGCNEWTAIGMRQGKGVIAVDPKVIKLRSKVYVPGYGLAVAGDTGGAIKGNIIDLGFEDARTAGWKAQFVDIYLLN